MASSVMSVTSQQLKRKKYPVEHRNNQKSKAIMTALGKMAPHSVFVKALFQTTVHTMDKHTAISPD